MLVILDTSLLISAYTSDGNVRSMYRHDLELVDLCISPEIFIEVERNLRRKEFSLTSLDVSAILKDILERCRVVRIESPPNSAAKHGTDWHLVCLAQQVQSDYILTGDKEFSQSANWEGLCCKRISDFVSQVISRKKDG